MSNFRPGQDTSKTNLIVNYLPQGMTEKELFAMFCTVGTIDSCKVMKDFRTGYSYGFGFVNYVSEEDALKAINTLNGLQVQNKRIKVSYARPSSEEIKDTNLYITNLPRDITDDILEAMFNPYGKIVQKNILKDKISGMPRGVAFVRYNTNQEAMEAINGLNGTVPDGSMEPIQVKIAEEHGKQKAAYYAGGFAGGRGGFRGGPNMGGRGGPMGRGGPSFRGRGGGPPPTGGFGPDMGGGYVPQPQGNSMGGAMRPDRMHNSRFNPMGMGGGPGGYYNSWN
ncbi:sex-lethal homolog isoform X2 [Neocloeon triangulifer]|uniref:sex-lethal homolog isoform X2 n=1 Tax=Neocloeon triangulifer TaxID=2078957 RepID=UPI00286F3568|nr:sex-lethal homolog isoform X2 [Neocloeon triangulifer]